ncbi:hypothetical protein EHQ75_15745 [Leptospira levettii]|uniref:hypothetical protein n=1 Tax=Leptospira levettii TaxID=2023178 RepID=UPI0010826FF9|nr:hypothetical protein [Leptospira levettii]TGM36583.1 hypothetical protein EHQ75_15745 [Leptospira levettii]
MKIYFFLFLFLYQCQISWYHTRVSINHGDEIPISQTGPVFNESGTTCFISSIPFAMEGENPSTKLSTRPIIDRQFIENLRTNLNLKGIPSKHIKEVFGIPKNWPHFELMQSFRTSPNFNRFKQIESMPIDESEKTKLHKFAEITDENTYFLKVDDVTSLFNDYEDCSYYYHIVYQKKEKDNYNLLTFFLTLGILPTVNYENHYYAVYSRKPLEKKLNLVTYKYGYRRLISLLLLPTFNFFNEVRLYNQDYRFFDHTKDQFLSSLENKNSEPLPIKYLNPVYGDVKDNVYISDSGLFDTKIPVDARYAVIRDGKVNVSFYDPIHGLYKIQAINVNQKINSDIITNGIEPTLKDFIKTKLVEKIQKKYPKSTIVHESFTPEYRDGTYTFILEINKPEANLETFKKEYFVFSCFKSQSQIFILSKTFLKEYNELISPQMAEAEIIDFYSKVNFRSKYIEPKPLDLEVSMNDSKSKSEKEEDEEEDDDDDDDEEGEEGEEEVAAGFSSGGEIDLGGLFSILKERTYIPKGKLDLKPGRFKFNSARFNAPKVTRSKFHIKPGRSKNFSRPAKWRR